MERKLGDSVRVWGYEQDLYLPYVETYLKNLAGRWRGGLQNLVRLPEGVEISLWRQVQDIYMSACRAAIRHPRRGDL